MVPDRVGMFIQSAPGRIRIPSLLIRSQVLYPIELRARDRPWRAGFVPAPRQRYRRVEKAPHGALDAQKRIRTSTTLRPPAPQAGASANSATWAGSVKCSGGESNPHGILLPQDPESCASANSATRASCSLAPSRDGFRERRPPPVRGGSVRRTESGADVPVSHGATKITAGSVRARSPESGSK